MKTANLFDLKNLTLKVTYSASGIDGKPHLSYKKGNTDLNFTGSQIRRKETEIGTLVSVTLKTVSDAYSRVFSLLLPRVNVPNGSSEVAVSVKALETTIKTSVAGPDLVSGQVQTYKVYSLVGKARSVVF
ncbi:MAG: hypothetical protein HUU34_00120 [Saprospiraceae bacterium]|jgi:hypothetical protein|nr:hypothetical protein [Saprospiraceae bacterium]